MITEEIWDIQHEFIPVPHMMREDFAYWNSSEIFGGQYDEHGRPTVSIRGYDNEHTLYNIQYREGTTTTNIADILSVGVMVDMVQTNLVDYTFIQENGNIVLIELAVDDDVESIHWPVIAPLSDGTEVEYQLNGSVYFYKDDIRIAEIEPNGDFFDYVALDEMLNDYDTTIESVSIGTNHKNDLTYNFVLEDGDLIDMIVDESDLPDEGC